jgi:hypothetical protein
VIQPTVGRVVWYWPTAEENHPPFPALVAYIHSDTNINVGGFDANGNPFRNTSVQLIQGDELPTGSHARWMPYQKGQAAKAEALEAKLADRGE